ncbi:MAG: hypothetical protein NZO58_00180 [Gemmataceae bacterium]|nr:hypothetical protein [Gemmataceae bacterium]
MIPHPTRHWQEIVAAYADGEFEGRDDLAVLRQRVEDWLARHPEAAEELAEYRRLKQLWQSTSPAEPPRQRWQAMTEAIAAAIASRQRPRTVRYLPWAAAACLALVAVLAWSLRPEPTTSPTPPDASEEYEIFRVAAAHEVEILNVNGEDEQALIVGVLPLSGAICLADHGDISITSVQPAEPNSAVAEVVVEGARRPMIWARVQSDATP